MIEIMCLRMKLTQFSNKLFTYLFEHFISKNKDRFWQKKHTSGVLI